MLFSTLLAGEKECDTSVLQYQLRAKNIVFNMKQHGLCCCSIDDGLVQEDSPFKASREFGIAYVTQRGECAAIGTVMRIQDYAPAGGDGRLLISNQGKRGHALDVSVAVLGHANG